MLSSFLWSLLSVWVWLILCCNWRFSFYRLCRRLFLAIVCIISHSFCLFWGASGREYIIDMWYLEATSLCSMRWCDNKMIVGLRNMSSSRFVWLRVIIDLFQLKCIGLMCSCVLWIWVNVIIFSFVSCCIEKSVNTVWDFI